MKKYAPLLTLLSVFLLGGGLLGANMLGTPRPPAPVAAADTAPPAAPAPAAAPAPTPAAGSYTGRSAGNEVTLALALAGGRAAGYVSDGRRIGAWFEGDVTGDRLTMRGDRNGVLTATVDRRTLLGTLTVDGVESPFSARAVRAPAGPYEGRGSIGGQAARVGWIVEESGNVTGLADLDGRVAPAPRIDQKRPVDVAVKGDRVTVRPLSADAEVVA